MVLMLGSLDWKQLISSKGVCAEAPAAQMESPGDQGQQRNAEQEGPSLGLPLSMGLHPHSIPQKRPPEVRHVTRCVMDCTCNKCRHLSLRERLRMWQRACKHTLDGFLPVSHCLEIVLVEGHLLSVASVIFFL